jgi:anthranilate phosphoribosyltransferase
VRSLPELIKHVGRGARLARELPEDEAEAAMAALVSGAADPVQVGGFLIAQRMKGETAGELAGFVRALRPHARLDAPAFDLDVDLHGDGREGRPSVALAAACVVASFGARVLLRGSWASDHARNDDGSAWARLGLDPTRGVAAAAAGAPVVTVELASYAPAVAALLALRAKLGVRTCVNSAVKLLDPTGARRVAAGIFHGPTHAPVAGAALRLGVLRAAVVQAPGGVPEVAPDKPTRVSLVDGGVVSGPEPFAPPGSAAPEPVATAEALAAQAAAVLAGTGPEGVVTMTVATAALWRWVAGQVADPRDQGVLSECYEALRSGAAAAVHARARLCYATA